jgi:hypothetical protein
LARALGYSSSWVWGGFFVASPCRFRAIRLVIDDHHEALACGVVAPGA